MVFIFTVDPIKQIEKARDTQRENNLFQVRGSLDTFYNDKNCYPLSLSFDGGEFSDSGTVYMKELPADCEGESCYYYQVDETSSCPQWNVLYTKVSGNVSESANRCPLEEIEACLPANYQTSGFNFCVVSGDVDCSYVVSSILPNINPVTPTTAPPTATPGGPTQPPVSTNTPTPTFTITPTPTNTPTPTPSCSKNYACTGSPARCNVVATGTGEYCASNCNQVCP